MRQTVLAFVLGVMVGTVATAVATRGPGAAGPPTGPGRGPALEAAPGRPDDVAALRQALERKAAENRALSEGLSRARAALRQAGGSPAEGGRPAADPTAVAADAAPPEPKAVLDPAAARRHVAELAARIPDLLASGDGAALLGVLKELAALGEAGYETAMDLAAKIMEDMRGEGKLKIDYRGFYRALASERMLPLLKYAVAHDEANARFRRMAVESLAWSEDPETVSLLAGRLPGEKDERVASEMAQVLADRPDPQATQALLDTMKNRGDRPEVRLAVVESLWESDNPEVERAMEEARFSDPDPKVREAAGLMTLFKHPPATGYLVTETYPDSQAAALGLKKGDIIVKYNGVEVTASRTLGEETRKVGRDQETTMLVNRGGRLIELTLKGSTIGINGQVVKPKR